MSWLKSFKQLSSIEKVLGVLFSFVLLLKFGECFVPYQHGDALSYHLVLPKLILERGFVKAHQDFYLGNIAGFFDYLYIIPQWIFESKLWAQIFSQFMHSSISLFLGVFTFYKIFKKNKATFFLGSLSLLTFARSADFFLYAKNDGALAVTFLLGTLLIFNRLGRSLTSAKKNLFIGICLGLMPAIKMSGLIYAATLGLFYLYKSYQNKESLKAIMIASGTSLAIVSITFIKNWIFVGNPLFPAFLEFFPTKATPEMITYMNSLLKKPANLLGTLQNYLIAFSPKALGVLVIPSLFYNFKKKRHELNQLIYLILIFTSLYCLINPGYPAERFYFGCHFVLFYFLTETLYNLFDDSKGQKTVLITVLLIFSLADSKIDKMFKRNYEFLKSATTLGFGKELLHKYIPHTFIWEKVKENSIILSDHLPMQYYAPKGSILYQAGHSQEANFLRTCQKPRSLGMASYLIRNINENRCPTNDFFKMESIYQYTHYQLLKISTQNE